MGLSEFLKDKESKNGFDLEDPLKGFTSTVEDEQERITLSKEGKLPQGLITGYEELDKHFRFKIGNLVIINGHANVGKSFGVWYLMVISYRLYGWRWIMFCAENVSADIRVQLVEFICGKLAKYIDDKVFKETLKDVYDTFEIIEIDEDMDMEENLTNLLMVTEKIMDNKGNFQGILIDPYNAVDLDIANMDRRLSIHDLHYSNAKRMRKFGKKHNVTFWVNMHAVTEALRKTDSDGYPIPPNPADTEGGGKWFNRADEFMTFHRYVQDSSRNRTSEFHIRKVKDTKTGGSPTDLNNPPKLDWTKQYDFHGFYDDNNFCPLAPLKKVGLREKIEKFPEAENNFDKQTGEVAPF